jgi:hypothetical protein
MVRSKMFFEAAREILGTAEPENDSVEDRPVT